MTQEDTPVSDRFTEDQGWLERRVIALQAQLATAQHELKNSQQTIVLLEAQAERLREARTEQNDEYIALQQQVERNDRIEAVVQAARATVKGMEGPCQSFMPCPLHQIQSALAALDQASVTP